MSCSGNATTDRVGSGNTDSSSLLEPIIVDNGQTYGPELPTGVAGVKGIRNYVVSDLTDATAAVRLIYNGKRYEARFYPDYAKALDPGRALTESVIGEDAKLLGDETLWLEGANDRRKCTRAAAHSGCPYASVYTNFAIIGNMILLCEGFEERRAVENPVFPSLMRWA